MRPPPARLPSAYRTNAKEEEEEVYVPKWKYVLMSASWGLVGVAVASLSILVAWAGPPSCEPSPCEDVLVNVDSHDAIACEHGSVYRGVLQITKDKRMHFCQCPGNAALDASVLP